MRITVDGGTEQWLQWIKKHECTLNNSALPELITGDMDSLSQQVLNHFVSRDNRIKVVVTPDQDETDFFKALRELSNYCLETSIEVCEFL